MAKAIWNGEVLAESDRGVFVEGNIYFPPDSVKKEFLKRSQTEYTCPWKGKSAYYNIKVDGEVRENAAWAYPEPKPAAQHIKGFVAFDTGTGIEVVD